PKTTLMVIDSSTQDCIYMNKTYCNNLNEREIERIVNDMDALSLESVSLATIFRQGSPTRGDNHQDRYVGHAASAIGGLQEMFGGKARNVILRGVPPNEVRSTIEHVRRLCEYLKGN